MTKPAMSKHQLYRARTKARALELMGGSCVECGFSEAKALRFHHVKPVRRGLNGLHKRDQTSTETHRAVVRGESRGILLLSLSFNSRRTAPPICPDLICDRHNWNDDA